LQKVLFILHYPPPIHGSSLVGGYIKESRLIRESFYCRFINLGTSVSVEEIGKNPVGKLLRYISLIWLVKKELIFFRPSLCYFTISSKGAGFYKDALIVFLVRLFGVKPVYHFHNKGIITRQNKFFDNILYRFVFRNSDVILLSKHLYPDVSKYVPEDRVHYCPNGIPDLKDKRQKSQDKSISAGLRAHHSPLTSHHSPLIALHSPLTPHPSRLPPEILFISHLIESKGIFILVDALKILNDRNTDFHCTMLGGESSVTRDQMQAKIDEAGLNERILIAGKKFGAEKEKAFEQADIFVHPTFEDCLPLVLLEAMQHSLPIVSTFEGAIPDVVKDGISGFLVPQKVAIALAEKLEILIKDPQLRTQMGATGRAKYEQEFTLERFEGRMVQILEEVAISAR
jgi:glycosyltransferase involved in cell wall biosynthesis